MWRGSLVVIWATAVIAAALIAGVHAGDGSPVAHPASEALSKRGYWGPVTSSLDWCEPNYVVTYFIAEFWNTFSNALFVVLGLYGALHSYRSGFESSFVAQYLGVAGIGLGSALFHATLRHVQQQSDETPMVISIEIWAYLLFSPFVEHKPALKALMKWVLIAYAAVFAVVHYHYRFTTFFQLHFMLWVLVCAVQFVRLYRSRSGSDSEDVLARRFARMYVQSVLIGFSCWLVDFHCCALMLSLTLNPQGHAFWHIFMGTNCYVGPLFVQYCRAHTLGYKRVRFEFDFGIIPVVRFDARSDDRSDADRERSAHIN